MIGLRRKYEVLVGQYISAFEKKHDIEFDYWVADRIGNIAVLGDYFMNFSDIRFDLDNEIPEDKIMDWYDLSVDGGLSGEPFLDFADWYMKDVGINIGFADGFLRDKFLK